MNTNETLLTISDVARRWQVCDTVMVDEFLLHSEVAAPDKGALTILRLLGSGIPEGRQWDPMYLRLRNGWERALLRLKASLEPAK